MQLGDPVQKSEWMQMGDLGIGAGGKQKKNRTGEKEKIKK
jgi:hypothetical protein